MSESTETCGDKTTQHPGDALEDITDNVREHGNYGELTMSGDVGFHTFFRPSRTDYGIGTKTALHLAFEQTVQELCIDADIVASNKGEVNPATVAAEAEEQLEHFIGHHRFFQIFRENLQQVLEDSEERYGNFDPDQEVLPSDD